MSTLNKGKLVNSVFDVLIECGEITGMELADKLNIGRYDAHAVLRRMNKRTKDGLKRLHIVRYIFDQEGSRQYPRPVYRVGDKKDAPKPKRDSYIKTTYRRKLKRSGSVNSAFGLGLLHFARIKQRSVSEQVKPNC